MSRDESPATNILVDCDEPATNILVDCDELRLRNSALLALYYIGYRILGDKMHYTKRLIKRLRDVRRFYSLSTKKN